MALLARHAPAVREHVLVQHVVIAENPKRAAEEAATRFRSIDAETALGSPFLLLGSVDHVAEALRERRERWGISYIVVFDQSAEDFAPVVERLAGT